MNNVKVSTEAMYLWRSDMVIENLGSENFNVNSFLSYTGNDQDVFNKQFSIEVDKPDVEYTLKLYYDKNLDTNVDDDSKVLIWDQKAETWNELSILEQDNNLQYIKVKGQGSQTYKIGNKSIDIIKNSDEFPMELYIFSIALLLVGILALYFKNNTSILGEPLKSIRLYKLFLPSSRDMTKIMGILISIIFIVVVSFEFLWHNGGILG